MEKVTFKNSAGLKLAGALHLPEAPTSKAVIIAHGFASNKDRPRHQQLAEALAASGIAALRIDFGGSGESEDREITIADQVEDFKAAVKFLLSHGYTDIGALGESLGGITALIAFDQKIKALALWAPVTRARWRGDVTPEQEVSLSENGYFIKHKDGKDFRVPIRYVDERKNIDREAVLSRITIPVLIVHGTADVIVPITDSQEAVVLLPPGSRLATIENWEHGDHKMDSDMETIVPITVNWFKGQLT